MKAKLNGNDGISLGYPILVTDSEEITLHYVPQFRFYSLDLFVDVEDLFTDEVDWALLIEGRFDELRSQHEEVIDE